jgi:1-acyl-sn-glycerol-3-phosphate acyltransferase
MRFLSKILFKLTGWKVIGGIPRELKQFVMVAAPHTSNWDFLYARAAFFIMGIRLRFTIKKELFFFPLNLFLKAAGGIPIDRKTKGNMVDKMAALYDNWDELALMVTPEGTRSYAKEWKKGFYFLALKAKVPIVCGYLDYKKKHAGIGPIIEPTGNYDADLEKLQSFFKTVTPRFPKNGVF